jgi:hypothetical protein
VPEYKNSEPIWIIFPSNRSSVIRDVFCDIPTIGGLDPESLWFDGLTWLPAELTIADIPLYASTNVSGLGFISMEKTYLDGDIVLGIFFSLISGLLWCLFVLRFHPVYKYFWGTLFSALMAQICLKKKSVASDHVMVWCVLY